MHEFDSVIFDLDGTLWDTAEVCSQAWNFALAELGKAYRKIKPEDIGGAMGLTADQVRAKIFFDLLPEEGNKLLRACFQQEVLHLKNYKAIIYPGVENGLNELSKKVPLFLVSNCDGPYLETFMNHSGLGRFFKDSECHGNTGLNKCENILKVVNRNNLKAPFYVGDTSGDENASKEAGVRFLFVEYGFGMATDFYKSFKTFSDLVEAL